MPPTVPRHPAWHAPTTPASASARSTAPQSATTTPSSSPRRSVTSPSCAGVWQGAATVATSAPWTCPTVASASGSKPSASSSRRRFSWTAATSSPVEPPRLSPAKGPSLTPPARVVKAAATSGRSAKTAGRRRASGIGSAGEVVAEGGVNGAERHRRSRPARERRGGLPDEHLHPADRAGALRSGLAEQPRLGGRVDEVVDGVRRAEVAGVGPGRGALVRVHPERRGVDDEPGRTDRRPGRSERYDAQRAVRVETGQVGSEGFGFLRRARGDSERFGPEVGEEHVDDGARRAPGAEHDDRRAV